jgi:hypothetical protein
MVFTGACLRKAKAVTDDVEPFISPKRIKNMNYNLIAYIS